MRNLLKILGIALVRLKHWVSWGIELAWENSSLTWQYRNYGLYIDRNVFIRRCQFGKHNKIYHHAMLVDCSLEDYSYVSEFAALHRTSVGKFCAIGPGTRIGLGNHPTNNFVSLHPVFFSKSNAASHGCSFVDQNHFQEFEDIRIGHDVWIGANAIIKDGVTIENGAVVGAGAVVTKNVPAYAIVGGSPARVIRYRFSEDHIQYIQEIKWWDKSDQWLLMHATDFLDIHQFIDQTNHSKNGIVK